jgi:hypothetical protein
MEVMVAVQSGTLLHALRVQLKRRVSARRGGDYIFLADFFPFFFMSFIPWFIVIAEFFRAPGAV